MLVAIMLLFREIIGHRGCCFSNVSPLIQHCNLNLPLVFEWRAKLSKKWLTGKAD
jgi:hypothetical protein